MPSLNLATRIYLAAIVGAAALLAAVTLRAFPHHDAVWEGIVFLLLAACADGLDLEISRGYRVSPVPVVHVAMVITLPPGLALVVVVLATIIEQAGHQRPAWYKAVFNVAHHVLIVMVPALLLQRWWPGPAHTSLAGAAPAIGVVASILSYYLLDTLLLSIVIALADRQGLRAVLTRNYLPTTLLDLTLGSMGALLGLLWELFPPFGLLVVPPVVVTHLAYRNLKRMERETLAAVEAMADVVDARDPYTAGHCRRVAIYAVWLAEELGLSQDELRVIVSAARVHDLGKIGVPDAVLLKPGRLTPDEYAVMQRHPNIGADLLAAYGVYTLGVALVRHHHEHVDGQGYPAGLVGDAVPLGARIIAVADTFDAMTTDRPYRRGLSDEAAIAELERGAGRQWDADLVRSFVAQVRVRGRLPAVPDGAATSAGVAA